MLHKLKPVPRFILIAVIVGGLGYFAYNAIDKNPNLKPAPIQQGQSSQPTQSSGISLPPVIKNLGKSESFNSYERIQSSREIKVAVQGNAAPFFNNGTGFNPDFLRLLTRQPEFSGINVRYVDEVNTYEEVPKALLKKAGDAPLADIAIDGLTLQDGDVGGVTYTVPYVSGFGYSLITTRTSGITSVGSVGSKRIGILKGDPDVASLVNRLFPSAQVVELSDALVNGQRTWIADAFKRGDVDALVYDYPFAVSEIAGTSLQFAVSKLPESEIAYKIGIRTGDNMLADKLNAAIARVVETEEYRGLLRTYFTSNKITTTRASAGERTYTVKSGDTLSIIAAATLGDSKKFPLIEVRNNLPNPNLIQVGQVLVIPNN